ncbi:MAG: hypothetical protein EAZ09_20930 [Oscillatoriales cyanobacterium]|nr:MAG: hypothetical protein EAZ18_27310 [Oscillatoriales cyanobacterium]TAH16745.1 MAG: hypothetical protein EAZ09_20930 [Oscillatoriales cyanobacterium]
MKQPWVSTPVERAKVLSKRTDDDEFLSPLLEDFRSLDRELIPWRTRGITERLGGLSGLS